MMTRVVTLTLFACLTTGLSAQAGGKNQVPMEVQQANAVVKQHLEKIGGLKQNPLIHWVDEASVKQAFPGTTFFAVRYRQYPVAIAPPEGLTSSNVLAVGKGGKVQVLKSPDDLPKFFLTEFQASKQKVTKETAQTYTKAWLNLVQELLQDGFYSFEIVKADAGIDAARIITATGRSMVTKGGNGEINVTIEFRADGGASADHKFNLIPGPRPKCQATKLLDPDPIVRHMAHSELLFMGMAARPYLLEQRDQASDARLRLAIDRVLQRIEAAGR